MEESVEPPTHELVAAGDVVVTPPQTTVVRIRMERGKVVQDCDVYIGRACNMGGWRLRQSKWANPFTLKYVVLEYCIV